MANIVEVKGNVLNSQQVVGKVNNSTVEIFPKLEDLNILPSIEKQVFKSKEFGYNIVTVDPTPLEEKEILPSKDIQEIIPSKNVVGLSKVTISGDENLIASNIKKGVSIFGVNGNMEGLDEITAYPKETTSAVYGYKSISYLNGLKFDFINSSSAYFFFQGWENLIECPELLNTQRLYDVRNMFSGCISLKTIPVMDFSNVQNTGSMFYNCTELQNVGGFINFGKRSQYSSYSLDLSDCKKLTHESLINIFNGVYDKTGASTSCTYKIIISLESMSLLNEEDKETITNKNWTLQVKEV